MVIVSNSVSVQAVSDDEIFFENMQKCKAKVLQRKKCTGNYRGKPIKFITSIHQISKSHYISTLIAIIEVCSSNASCSSPFVTCVNYAVLKSKLTDRVFDSHAASYCTQPCWMDTTWIEGWMSLDATASC